MNLKATIRNNLKSVYGKLGLQQDRFMRLAPGEAFSESSMKINEGMKVKPGFYDKPKFLLTDSVIANKEIVDSAKRIKSIDEVPEDQIRNSVFYIYFECDSDALYHLRKIVAHGGTFIPPLAFTKTEYRFTNRAALDTIQKTWGHKSKLSHLNLSVHENLCEALDITRHLEGDYVEFGVYRGTSAYTVLNYLAATGQKRRSWLFDTFDGFNYDEATTSADAIWAGTHKLFGPEETKRRIAELLSETGQEFSLIQKNICEGPLPAEISRVVVANIDVDIYDATLAGMVKVAPSIVPGGIMICEDAAATPGLYGAYVAMKEFLDTEEGGKFVQLFKGGQYFLYKKSA